MVQIWMLYDEWLPRYEFAYKILLQRDANMQAHVQGDYNSSPCTSYR